MLPSLPRMTHHHNHLMVSRLSKPWCFDILSSSKFRIWWDTTYWPLFTPQGCSNPNWPFRHVYWGVWQSSFALLRPWKPAVLHNAGVKNSLTTKPSHSPALRDRDTNSISLRLFPPPRDQWLGTLHHLLLVNDNAWFLEQRVEAVLEVTSRLADRISQPVFGSQLASEAPYHGFSSIASSINRS